MHYKLLDSTGICSEQALPKKVMLGSKLPCSSRVLFCRSMQQLGDDMLLMFFGYIWCSVDTRGTA